MLLHIKLFMKFFKAKLTFVIFDASMKFYVSVQITFFAKTRVTIFVIAFKNLFFGVCSHMLKKSCFTFKMLIACTSKIVFKQALKNHPLCLKFIFELNENYDEVLAVWNVAIKFELIGIKLFSFDKSNL